MDITLNIPYLSLLIKFNCSKGVKCCDAAAYFNTLAHNLNVAIYYCAAALNYVITHGVYTDCACSGENPQGEDPIDDRNKDKFIKINSQISSCNNLF